MSDYGSRSHGSGSGEYGWGGESRNRGFGDSYDDYSDYAPRQQDGGYGATARVDPYSVRSSSPHDEPVTSGRARVPGADGAGPNPARGSARVGGARRRGAKGAADESDDMKKARKKKKRRRKLVALTCVMVMLLGIGTVVGTLFFESVDLPSQVAKDLARNTTITYADGKKMGKIGNEGGNRSHVNVREDGKAKKDNDVPEEVKFALLAMEDRGFYEHPGVDFWGVMRALVNNVTGGDTQGASTLTQQYVGQVAKIRGDDSYMRKAREAVMAMKMNDEYKKDQIIEHYLNLVYMGRGAYGLGAAVKAWYGDDKKVKDLTASEAALIFAQIKNPSGKYDPTNGDEAKKQARERWEYCLDGMVEQKWLKGSERDKIVKGKMPEPTDTEAMTASEGQDESTGFVSHGQVLDEAKEDYNLTEQDVRTKGLTITTTIDEELQDLAVKVANHKNGTAMGEQQENLRAALVAINPEDGAVLAYYGGSQDGTNSDKAAAVHPPGSSFKEVTMAAGMKKGYGPDSMWDGSSPRDFDERPSGPVHNSGEGDGRHEPRISLRKAIELSLNTPMYAMASDVGANKVVEMAQAMGVEKMEVPIDDQGNTKVFDLDSKKAQNLINSDSPREFADNEVGYGQYPVPVVDMAAVNATLAAEGAYHETHYIKKITKADGEVMKKPDHESNDALSPDKAANATDILTAVHPSSMSGNRFTTNGQEFAAKSGTWERDCGDGCEENASISFGGYVPELASAAWVGDKQDENGKVANTDGSPAFGAGISGEVWRQFMKDAVTMEPYNTKRTFPPASGTGTLPGELEPEDGDDEGDGGEDGDDGGESCEEGDPECDTGGQPSCPEGQPDCQSGGEPTCGGPLQPECPSDGTTCQPPDQCEDGFGEESVRPDYFGGDGNAVQHGQYAVRERYSVSG